MLRSSSTVLASCAPAKWNEVGPLQRGPSWYWQPSYRIAPSERIAWCLLDHLLCSWVFIKQLLFKQPSQTLALQCFINWAANTLMLPLLERKVLCCIILFLYFSYYFTVHFTLYLILCSAQGWWAAYANSVNSNNFYSVSTGCRERELHFSNTKLTFCFSELPWQGVVLYISWNK